jgi:hypothetical protein
MASIQTKTGGVRIFSGAIVVTSITAIRASFDAIEDEINNFLNGEGTVDEPKKMIVFPPNWVYDATSNFATVLVTYKPVT